MFKKVALGVSGGVDSAVAALILKRRGYDVQGVFMQNWDIRDETGKCSSDADYEDASLLCKKLDICLHHKKFVKQYWNEVFTNLIKDYQSGFTPNPDILCNKNIKFHHFYHYALDELKVDAIATGHYAHTSFGCFLEHFEPDKVVRLLRAKDTKKDQTFFLSQISQKALKRTMFPLGELMKWEVKQIALEHNLEKFARKPESMGICFIGSRNFQSFIKEYIDDRPGDFIDIDTGKVVGHHNGIHQWTIGQRTRLQGLPQAYFTAKKNVEENVIYVAQGTKHPALYSTLFFTSKPHWINGSQPEELQNGNILNCDFKFQHTEELMPCKVCETERGLSVKLEVPKRALTPGQYAVFYKNNECLGSGRIFSSGASNFSIYYLQNKTLHRSPFKSKIDTSHIDSSQQKLQFLRSV